MLAKPSQEITPQAETLVAAICGLTRRDDLLAVAIAALWALEGLWAPRKMPSFKNARLLAEAILKRIQGKV